MVKRLSKKLFMAWAIMAVIMITCCAPISARAADPVLYRGKMYRNARLLSQKDTESTPYLTIGKNTKIDILAFDPYFLTVSFRGYVGYMKRDHVTDIEPVDPVNTPPYGVEVNQYVASVKTEAIVRAAPQADGEALITLYAGARLSFIDITDGWARLIFHRQYAYVYVGDLENLTPVSVDVNLATREAPIAAFTSFYKITTDEVNLGRMANIAVACTRMSKVMAPGDELNFNDDIGPYSPQIGYQLAYVLVDGKSIVNYGGGTCQTSSTLYNVALQLPQIEVLQRRPHGPSGATYLPHGVDAAVGNDSLNLRIRNNYDFPIRIDASSQDGALYISIYRETD